MAEQPPRPPDEDETVSVPPDEDETVIVPPDGDETVVVPPGDETVVQDEWAVAPERRVHQSTVEDVEEIEEETPPERALWPWLLALLALVLVVLGVVFLLSRDDDEEAATTTASMVTVPDVVGRTVDNATTAMEAVGLEVGVVRVPSAEEPGTVVAQAPGAGNEVEEGTTVSLKVARPLDETTTAPPPATTAPPATSAPPATTAPAPVPQPAVVPDVVGRPVADAAEAFGAEGLFVDLFYVPSEDQAGTVVSQAQAPGTELQPGDLVQVNISNGPDATEFVSVPDVAGLPLDEARAAIEQARFEVLALNLDDDVRNTDGVDLQTPEAGAALPPGSLVVLYVSR